MKTKEYEMKNVPSFAIALCLMSLVQFACGFLTSTKLPSQINDNSNAVPGAETSTTIPVPFPVSTVPPTATQPELEVVQFQAWKDYQENARANVLLRNPYDFPVSLVSSGATLRNSTGELMRAGELYFLDGISGGNGFILPGETIAANVCFTCEAAVLTEDWASVDFKTKVEDATDRWDYSTEVEANVGEVSFEGNSPIFNVTGTVTNKSNSALQRISVRIFVFDQEGKLVGASESSAWGVEPGTTVNFDGYGIGQTLEGPVTYEITALGVNY